MCAEHRSVQHIGDELYQLPPAAFTAARDAAVAKARASGDAATATAVAAMKKPSAAAWLVNLVALRSPESVHRLVALGETIRSAQSGAVSGPSQIAAQLRDLAATRRSEMAALLASVEQLAAAAGAAPPTRAQLADVEATISAAMADDMAARTVRAGRVLKPLAYHGFGPGDEAANAPAASHAPAAALAAPTGSRPGSVAGSVAATTPARAPDPEARRVQARERHEASVRHLAEARQSLLRTQSAEANATQRLRSLVEQRAEIQQELAYAGDDVRVATRNRLAAERAVAAAERAEAVASRANAALDT